MANKARFKTEPPHEPLVTLRAVVDDWIWRHYERQDYDLVVEYCALAPDFETAVNRACASRGANGKHHPHQTKVRLECRQEFADMIIKTKARVMHYVDLDDFEGMHDLLSICAPWGIGPVTVYDVATRIAGYLGIKPKCVFLHAGVRLGANALFGAAKIKHMDRIPVEMLPDPLNTLDADRVEDIFCGYRTIFEAHDFNAKLKVIV